MAAKKTALNKKSTKRSSKTKTQKSSTPTTNILTKAATLITKTLSYAWHHKLITLLILVLLLPVYITLNSKYKDYDNAQLIKGLARDFPLLIQELEEATGLDMEIKNGCGNTQEKFGGGVSICALDVGMIGYPGSNEIIDGLIQGSSKFKQGEVSEHTDAYRILYRNKVACSIGFNLSGKVTHSFYLSCQTGVRAPNTNLAIQEFSKIHN